MLELIFQENKQDNSDYELVHSEEGVLFYLDYEDFDDWSFIDEELVKMIEENPDLDFGELGVDWDIIYNH